MQLLSRAADLPYAVPWTWMFFLEGKKKDCYYFLLFLDFAKLR